jgi:hypothetical protein
MPRSLVLWACAVATTASAAPASPLAPADLGALVMQHRANERAIGLAMLGATHGSPGLRVLGRHIARELAFIDGQVVALIHARGTAQPVSAHNRSAEDRLFRLAKLDGLAFDRALLSALQDELQGDVEWLDAAALAPRDGSLLTLLATVRPALVRQRAQVEWLGRALRPPS